MDFRAKMKTRLYVAVIYIALGVLMIAGAAVSKTENGFISSFGMMLAVMGLARLRQYRRIMRSEESLREQEIRETDERNVMLVNKARGLTFILYLLLVSIAVIILSLFGLHEYAELAAYSVWLLVAIYWVCYLILKKRY